MYILFAEIMLKEGTSMKVSDIMMYICFAQIMLKEGTSMKESDIVMYICFAQIMLKEGTSINAYGRKRCIGNVNDENLSFCQQ
jgi:predicted Na+-dependent transporter